MHTSANHMKNQRALSMHMPRLAYAPQLPWCSPVILPPPPRRHAAVHPGGEPLTPVNAHQVHEHVTENGQHYYYKKNSFLVCCEAAAAGKF